MKVSQTELKTAENSKPTVDLPVLLFAGKMLPANVTLW